MQIWEAKALHFDSKNDVERSHGRIEKERLPSFSDHGFFGFLLRLIGNIPYDI